ncbi:1-phosphofructokinase family hexose kinase [Flagellimonas lutaonensis]|uniref:Phosphofructokinase n=1 Tax=Flagellimonas lutaonensis TaxID=516051 RepID=A0A0D5YPV1_9FLAO|nr:1-phosphofructokinase family hexose kinase [Allomuricauda lutaonensis]AKA34257.1 phosphofructokinase [Allomuricauda lutaonensis]
MNNIITLTVNPALDKSTTVAGIVPNKKLRCASPVFDPGGGGINVSRAIKKLGGTSLCMYLAGGQTGNHLTNLLTKEGIRQETIFIEGWTRDNLSVTDTATEQQYRFGMPGPNVSKAEWLNCLEEVEKKLSENDFLIASGRLAPKMPNDFYARLSALAKKKEARLVLDTSGEALKEGAAAGVYLLKPNLGELSTLLGVTSITADELEPLSKKFVKEHHSEVLVVSLGAKGALLVTKDLCEHIPAPTVHQKSTVGAGDSMVAGMVFGLANGKSLSEMVRYGVACGTAATMTPGTELCRKEDVNRLYEWIVHTNVKN